MSELLEAIDGIAETIRSQAATAERLNRPTPVMQEALKGTGVFRMLMGAHLGGLEASPTEALEIVERVSYVEPSLGWIVRVIARETAYVASHLSQQVLAELGENLDDLLIGGQSWVVGGTAIPEEGGYRITGSWRYSPGLAMATHVVVCVGVSGSDEQLMAAVSREQLSVQDNWNMLGLRASASFDYEATDLFVPERYTFRADQQASDAAGIGVVLGPALYAALNQGAWAQGVARRMLDELKALALSRLGSGEGELVSDEFYAEFARHHSHVQGTMALLRTSWEGIEQSLRQGERLSDEQETIARLAASLSTRTVLEIAQLAHRYAGAYVMRNSTMQRLFRDAHAGTQHRGTASAVNQQCGKVLIGAIPEGAHWGDFGLVMPS